VIYFRLYVTLQLFCQKKLLSAAYTNIMALAISGVTKEGHLSPGAAFLGRQIEVGMLRNNYKLGWFK